MAASPSSGSTKNRVVGKIDFSPEQRRHLEQSTGLTGLTGLDLIELGAEERQRIMPGLARASVAVLCW